MIMNSLSQFSDSEGLIEKFLPSLILNFPSAQACTSENLKEGLIEKFLSSHILNFACPHFRKLDIQYRILRLHIFIFSHDCSSTSGLVRKSVNQRNDFFDIYFSIFYKTCYLNFINIYLFVMIDTVRY